MIFSAAQIERMVRNICEIKESEIIELKTASTNFSFNDLGKYFSALSNEANVRQQATAWLLFGINDDGVIVGTAYRSDGKLQNLKKEVAERTNQRLTFREIYELCIDGKRVIAFLIPAALPGVPTTWNGAPYAISI